MNPFRTAACTFVLAGVFAILPRDARAQVNRSLMKEASSGTAVTWWVIGSGGVIGSADQGDFSATVGQTAIFSAASDRNSAALGFWLPEPAATLEADLDEVFDREQNELEASSYPNPFRSSTTISYRLQSHSHVRVRIYNSMGNLYRVLTHSEQDGGRQNVAWDGANDAGTPAPSGAYIVTVEITGAETPAGANPDRTLRTVVYRVR